MKIKKTFLTFILTASVVLTGYHTQAQDHDLYEGSIGIRAGVKPGISAKYFISDVSAFETLVQFPYNGVQITQLYETHLQAFQTPRLHWVLGIGAHVGIFDAGDFEDRDGDVYDKDVTTFGLDALVGLEYTFDQAPFTMAVDVKPFIDLVNPGADYLHAAFTIRYYW